MNNKLMLNGFFSSKEYPVLRDAPPEITKKIMEQISSGLSHLYNQHDGTKSLVDFVKDDAFRWMTWRGRPIATVKKIDMTEDGVSVECEPTSAFAEWVATEEREFSSPLIPKEVSERIKYYATRHLETMKKEGEVQMLKEGSVPMGKVPTFRGIDLRSMSVPIVSYIPTPRRIIYNDPATIVFWDDGTKTVVKRSDSTKPKERFNKYHAFCAALAKKLYGNNSRVNAYVESGIVQKPKKKNVKKETKTNG